MDDESRLLEAFGRAVFLSHIIEDRLKIHIFDCAFFSVGCMAHVAHEKTKKATFEELIDFYRLAHHGREDTLKLWRQLHLFRQIRNRLVHGFILQIHEDLQHEEGRDQIIAMLERVSAQASRLSRVIREDQDQIVADYAKNLFRTLEHSGHPLKEGLVASSEIQRWLEEIDKEEA